MKIVVTGATGNVGTSTIQALALDSQVEEIVGIARRQPSVVPSKTRFEQADITTDELAPLMEGADAIIHLACLIQPERKEDYLNRVNIDGSRRVFRAAVQAGVRSIVYASSVGTYGPGPKTQRVNESYSTAGIRTSLYSRQKSAVERELDRLEQEHPELRVVRVRPGLIFKRTAGSEIRRLFVGPFVPSFMFDKRRIPWVPDVDQLRFQCVHSLDVGRAFALAATTDFHGAVNVAAEPIVEPRVLAEALEARRVRLPGALLRWSVQAAWRLRISPISRGWVDLALGVPLMDTRRARDELGWEPRYSSVEALQELLQGLREGAGMDTVPLQPQRESAEAP